MVVTPCYKLLFEYSEQFFGANLRYVFKSKLLKVRGKYTRLAKEIKVEGAVLQGFYAVYLDNGSKQVDELRTENEL